MNIRYGYEYRCKHTYIEIYNFPGSTYLIFSRSSLSLSEKSHFLVRCTPQRQVLGALEDLLGTIPPKPSLSRDLQDSEIPVLYEVIVATMILVVLLHKGNYGTPAWGMTYIVIIVRPLGWKTCQPMQGGGNGGKLPRSE